MIATIKEINGELYLVFPEGQCPFNLHDVLEWELTEKGAIIRVVQSDLFSE